MFHPFPSKIQFDDSPSIDGFGRSRVSEPQTLFDSKLLYDKAPLLWDESLESGAGITSTYDSDCSCVNITNTATTAGTFTRQTFMRFNYQPGKSQQILMTGIINASGAVTGVTRRIGLFDDNDGLFFEDVEGTFGVVRRTSTSGSPVNNRVVQSAFNIDTLDGNGPSGYTLDVSKTNIFFIDIEWLGVGRVRMGVVIDGKIIYCHQFLNANQLTEVYMKTPNLPLRYQMVSDADAQQCTLKAICSTVISEGGQDELGVLRGGSTAGTLNANTTSSVYAVIGLRLKSTHLGATIRLADLSLLGLTADDFEYYVYLNPTVAGNPVYTAQSNSAVELAVGDKIQANSDTTVSGGTLLGGGLVKGGGDAIQIQAKNAIYLGSAIDGTRDEIWVCVQPFTSNLDIAGTLQWREIY